MANTWYVKPATGNDAHDGTSPVTAFQTSTAVEAVINSGDTIELLEDGAVAFAIQAPFALDTPRPIVGCVFHGNGHTIAIPVGNAALSLGGDLWTIDSIIVNITGDRTTAGGSAVEIGTAATITNSTITGTDCFNTNVFLAFDQDANPYTPGLVLVQNCTMNATETGINGQDAAALTVINTTITHGTWNTCQCWGIKICPGVNTITSVNMNVVGSTGADFAHAASPFWFTSNVQSLILTAVNVLSTGRSGNNAYLLVSDFAHTLSQLTCRSVTIRANTDVHSNITVTAHTFTDAAFYTTPPNGTGPTLTWDWTNAVPRPVRTSLNLGSEFGFAWAN